MKKLFFLLVTGSLFLATSCKDDESTNSISTSDAAEVVAAAVGSESGGAALYITTSANASANDNSLKSAQTVLVLADSTAADNGDIISATAGDIGDWQYSWHYTHTLVYGVTPGAEYVNSVFDYSGSVDVPRFNASHSGNGNFVYTSLGTLNAVAPLITINPYWTMNGTFTRTGSHTAKQSGKQITHTTTISFDDCEVTTDGTRKIVSGIATVHITGSVPSKGKFEYNGTVTFGSGSTGSLNIDGKVYAINVTSGEVN